MHYTLINAVTLIREHVFVKYGYKYIKCYRGNYPLNVHDHVLEFRNVILESIIKYVHTALILHVCFNHHDCTVIYGV